MPRIGRLLFGISVALAGLAAVGVALAGQLATVSHFQCYRVDPGGVFKSPTLVLSTQFGRQKDSVNPMQSICAPAHKNGSVVANPAAHLGCYQLKAPSFASRTVLITNQFETSTPMTVLAPLSLCVPSGKSIASTTVPPLAKGLDNYECYSVKPQGQEPTHPITVIDQFGEAGGSALQPLTLCAPVQINGSPLINATIHLVCYGVKLGPNVKPTHVSIHNRFGVSTATVVQRQSLCVPSIKKLG